MAKKKGEKKDKEIVYFYKSYVKHLTGLLFSAIL